MPKDIKRKPYSPPLVYDIGGPNLNVVGLTGVMCQEGGTRAGAACASGAPALTNECETGGRVASSCSTGVGEVDSKNCGTGLTPGLNCFNGTSPPAICGNGTLVG